MEGIERKAPSVEEAIEAALTEMGLSEQEVDVDVLQEPRGGFLGVGAQEAVVRVRPRRGPREVDPAMVEEQVDLAVEFLEGLMEGIGIEADVESHVENGITYVDVWGAEGDDEMGLVIGRHGQGVESLQEVLRVYIGRKTGERCAVLVDVEDYRKRRRERLVARAVEISHRVRRTGRAERFEPMNAFERKIIHDAVGTVDGV